VAHFYWRSILNMPPKKRVLTVAEKERTAAQLLAASEGLISTFQAMKTIGLASPQRSDSRKKRVHRHAQKIKIVRSNEASTTTRSSTVASAPRQLVMGINKMAQDQFVSSLSAPPSNSRSNCNNQGPETREQNELRRQLAINSTKEDVVPQKKRCRSSQQKHLEESEKNEKRKLQSAAVKSATTQIAASMQMSPTSPNKRSQHSIAKDLNDRLGSYVSHKSVSRMVREGKI